MVLRKPFGAALFAVTLLAHPAFAVEDSLQKQESIDKNAVASQQRIDKLADQTADALQNYRTASQRLESLTIYNQQMEKPGSGFGTRNQRGWQNRRGNISRERYCGTYQ